MTGPMILPGPFDFLRTGGQAAIESYQSEIARKRQQELQQLNIFTQLLPFLSANSQGQYDQPEGVQSSFQHLLGAAPNLGPSVQTRTAEQQLKALPAQQAAGLESTKTSTKRTAAEIPGVEAQSAVAAADAERYVPILQQLSSEQYNALKGILPPEVAALGEKVQYEKLKTELEAQDPARQDIRMQTMIREHTLKMLPKDPQMAMIADYAAIGGLGFLIAGMQQHSETARMAISANRDRYQALNTISLTARQLAVNAQKENDAKRNKEAETAANQYRLIHADEKDVDKNAMLAASAAAKDFDKRSPDPKYETYLEEVATASGYTLQQYQEGLRELGKLAATEQSSTTSTTKTKAGGAAKQLITKDQADYLKSINKWDASKYEIKP